MQKETDTNDFLAKFLSYVTFPFAGGAGYAYVPSLGITVWLQPKNILSIQIREPVDLSIAESAI